MEDQVASDVCPNCLEPVPESDTPFCPNCGGPIESSAELDPINVIRSEGHMFRRAADRPSLVIVLGVWLIFLPTLFFGITSLFKAGRELPAVMLLMLVFCALPIAVLYRTTKNYVRKKKVYEETDNEDEEQKEL